MKEEAAAKGKSAADNLIAKAIGGPLNTVGTPNDVAGTAGTGSGSRGLAAAGVTQQGAARDGLAASAPKGGGPLPLVQNQLPGVAEGKGAAPGGS